jgi:uncharacterized protein YfeS
MQFYLMARTYNTYGSHLTLSLIPDLLLRDASHFGLGISELTVTLHFPHVGRALPTLEQMFIDFHMNRQRLPRVVFRRARRQVSIDIASDLLDGKAFALRHALSLPLFAAGVSETITALELLRRRISKEDDFELEAFLTHCSQARASIPATDNELQAFANNCEKSRAKQNAAMSPWERLDVDWRDFHPKARAILDDPFYWDCSNAFAPNGNDTGADLLTAYQTWLTRNPSGDPIAFFHRLIEGWGFPPDVSSDLARTVRDEAAIALAFAELKLRADCRPAVAALARAALQRQHQQAIDATHWPHKEERLKSLKMLCAKLPSPPLS